MKRVGMLVMAIIMASAWAAAQDVAEKAAPKVEVAFVLDTTGSMGGLIAGAKAKIWYIANQIVLGEPRPRVRMALVGYRDKGDEYVTKVTQMTDNIDQVHSDLMAFQANGGGDGPEHVNKGLYDAVNSLSWSSDDSTLKIIYLVGDYPPHDEYTDTPKYAELAKAAIEKGIYINTVLCGGNEDTAKVWREVARLAEGRYFQIAQDGGVQEIPTPYDERLAELNAALVKTVVVYGTQAEQVRARALNTEAAAPESKAVAADRASFSSKSERAGTQDLVSAVTNREVNITDMDKDELPSEMQSMNTEEQTRYLAAKQAERDKVHSEIEDLSAKRSQYIREAMEKDSGPRDAFDTAVVDALREQARTKNITYKEETK